MKDEWRLFYVADIHGSERCFRKWLNAAHAYGVDAILLGGDIAGKLLMPVVATSRGRYLFSLHGEEHELADRAELDELTSRLRVAGQYVVVLDPEEKTWYDSKPDEIATKLFPAVVADSVKEWVKLAEERLSIIGIPAYVMLGNDDFPELEPLLSGTYIRNVEGSVVELPGGYEMISLGFSNPTPWDTPRELDEATLEARITDMADRLNDPATAIFNLHCPPYETGIDEAPMLDDTFRPRVAGGSVATGPVGSTAVRRVIERYEPLMGLHGHIHESPGARRLNRSLCINPGSDYADGVLRGAIVTLNRKKGVKNWQLTQG